MLEPIDFTCAGCTFGVVYNVRTKETFGAHSEGAWVSNIGEMLTKAQEQFDNQDEIVFIIGGGGIYSDLYEKVHR